MLKYPNIRKELIEWLQTLGKTGEFIAGVEDEAEWRVLVAFFDNLGFWSNPEATLGSFLNNKAELESVLEVTRAIHALHAEFGHEAPLNSYRNSVYWPLIRTAAVDALHGLEE